MGWALALVGEERGVYRVLVEEPKGKRDGTIVPSLIWRSEDPPATITTCTVAAVSVFYTPDDGRLTPETCI